MIVDCHTHVWQSPEQLGNADLGELSASDRKALSRNALSGTPSRSALPGNPELHRQNTASVDRVFVLGFRSRYLNAHVPNEFLARYVGQNADRLVGFAGIDPTEDSAADDVRVARELLKLRGIAVSPAGQDFHPSDTRAMAVYEIAETLGMPVVFHGVSLTTPASKLEFSQPHLIDEVARSFPNLRIVIAQLGSPWIDPTLAMLAKHKNVFADISGLLMRPWFAYNALVNAFEHGVIEKLLFGSDYPYTDPAACIERLYSINQLVQGTNLPVVPREALRGIVERDAIELLGLE